MFLETAGRLGDRREREMLLSLATIVLASNLVVAAAGEIPQFNLDLSCRGVEIPGLERGRTAEVCKRSEQNARDQLTKQWTQFPSADKTRCVQLATMGGVTSYVELITCLEMARDVRGLRNSNSNSNSDTTGTTGLGGNLPNVKVRKSHDRLMPPSARRPRGAMSASGREAAW